MRKLTIEAEDATLAHMNTGTEKAGDEDQGRVDLKLEVSMSGKVLSQLVTRNGREDEDLYGNEEDEQLLDHIYDQHGRPRMHHVTEITLDTEFENHVVTLNEKLRLTDCKVNKFRVVPLGGSQVSLLFRVQAHPTPEQVAVLYGWQKKVITIDLAPGDAPADEEETDTETDTETPNAPETASAEAVH